MSDTVAGTTPENRDTSDAGTIVEARDVKKHFPLQTGFIASILHRGEVPAVRAVDGVDFDIRRGEVFALGGESGSGKSTVGRLVLNLLEPTEGTIRFDGVDLSTLSAEEMRRLRSRMQIIFQDPLASLNPRMTVSDTIAHPLEIHDPQLSDRERRRRVFEMLVAVGMAPPRVFSEKYPHQISGGQRQRVVIARALVTRPELIIADEPIAMADVSVRSVLLDLMMKLKDEFDLTYLFITHDLATAKYVSDRIAIMYLGRIVEVGPLKSVYQSPAHPYTEALLDAVPVPDPRHRRTQPMPRGEIPSPINPPSGCRFHPRCPIAEMGLCDVEDPSLMEVPDSHNHVAACLLRAGPRAFGEKQR